MILGWKDVHGGFHDAGDYGTYVSPESMTMWTLVTAYDIAPEKFPDDLFNTPESGNGISDLLDEVSIIGDFFLRLQVSDAYPLNACGWWR